VAVPAARAEDIATKPMLVKKASTPQKRAVVIRSDDAGIQAGELDSPNTKGASGHVHSATDGFCLDLPAGA
jgi:hypothetical protein